MIKFFIVTLLLAFVFGFFITVRRNVLFAEKSTVIVSPLPRYLSDSNLVKQLSFWQPKEKNVRASSIIKPQVSAKAVLLYDTTTDTVLYEKNSKDRMPIASLVKIATAVVALETKEPVAKMRVSANAASVGENSMGATAGEAYTLEELLYGLVLHSGNDAAMTIAEGVSGTSNNFVLDMNRKAKILGLSDTFFVNPSGLEEEEGLAGEYSSAHDLVMLTKYALTLPLFAKVVQTFEYHIPAATEHKQLDLYNQTNLLTTYPGVKGVKTGFTPSSGLCLVTYAENGGHKIIGVILNSQQRREEMKELLDYSFSVLGVHVPGRT